MTPQRAPAPARREPCFAALGAPVAGRLAQQQAWAKIVLRRRNRRLLLARRRGRARQPARRAPNFAHTATPHFMHPWHHSSCECKGALCCRPCFCCCHDSLHHSNTTRLHSGWRQLRISAANMAHVCAVQSARTAGASAAPRPDAASASTHAEPAFSSCTRSTGPKAHVRPIPSTHAEPSHSGPIPRRKARVPLRGGATSFRVGAAVAPTRRSVEQTK